MFWRISRQRWTGRYFWLVAMPSALLVMATLYAALRFADPMPPDRLVISSGQPGAGYTLYAERYRARMARAGVFVEIRYSGGSADNLARMRNPASGVDAAFTTVGVANAQDAEHISSLGGVFPSALFVFYRGEDTVTRFSQFRGKRLSIGTSGTFLRAALLKVLQASDAVTGTLLASLGPEAALKSLVAGDLDAAMFPGSIESPLVQSALRAPGVRLMNVVQADAISKRVPELRRVVLARGAIDLARDEPAEDVSLLASLNALVVRRDLHPALQLLLLDTARNVHAVPAAFQRYGEYPAAQAQDLPLSDVAIRYYQSGRPFLFRYLGFRLAALADRLAMVLLPVIAVVVTVSGYAPPLYRWLNRRRIWRWHEELLEIESALDSAQHAERTLLIARLDEAVAGINRIKVARPFLDEIYHLRNHLRAVRERFSASPADPGIDS